MSTENSSNHYIGLMSGTSMDGCDAVLIEFTSSQQNILASLNHPYPQALREKLITLSQAETVNLEKLMSMDSILGRFFAETVLQLLKETGIQATQVRAIGCHGQTIRHLPSAELATSMQIGDPNLIAEITGITTIADFRRRDMAAGGQGAPLVPAFHQSVFHNSSETNVVLNIGGIANITVLPPNPADTSGFDTGPGNVLLDSWAQLYLGTNMDENGDWGANGQVDDELLNLMLTDKYFSLAAPKSTGREDFNLDWLKSILNDCSKTPNTPEQAQNIQASLCALTAHSISSAIKSHAALTKKVLVCGGGIHNKALMKLLTSLLDGCELISTEQYGIHPDWVEAAAFAWLAKQRIENQAGNIPNVTGAKHPVILGAIYPAAVNPQSS